MSDVRKCTPAEIEQKRRQALEKFRKAQELKKIRSSENRLQLPVTQEGVVQSGKSQLSDRQRAEIEQKRNAAIERAKANKLITPSKAEDLKKVSPGKATAPSKVAITQSRINPYLKPQNKVQSIAVKQTYPQEAEKSPAPGKAPPPSKEALASNRANPYEKSKPRIVTPAKPAVPVLVSLEITSENRFVAKTDGYSEAVINEFKKLKTKAYSELFQLNIERFDCNLYSQQINKPAPGHSTSANTICW